MRMDEIFLKKTHHHQMHQFPTILSGQYNLARFFIAQNYNNNNNNNQGSGVEKFFEAPLRFN